MIPSGGKERKADNETCRHGRSFNTPRRHYTECQTEHLLKKCWNHCLSMKVSKCSEQINQANVYFIKAIQIFVEGRRFLSPIYPGHYFSIGWTEWKVVIAFNFGS